MTDTPEYEGYEDLVRLGRALTPEDRQRFSPPADLWAKIANEAAAEDSASVAKVSDRRPSHRRIMAGIAMAGAAACVVFAVFAFALARGGDDTRTIDEVALSNAGLDQSGAPSSGSARLVVLEDGSRAIDLDVSDLPQVDDGFFELWLIDKQVNGMVSLGPVHGSGRYLIPPGVGTDAFPIVDLSIEPVDGVPTHSGKSVLRGVLA